MKRMLIAGLVAVSLVFAAGGVALAAQPANPGCFGTDRAANNQYFQTGGAPGASEWGHIAASRGSDNGFQNYAYRVYYCGGGPS